MGEIKKQSISGTLFTYGGALLGFIISGLIYPRFLEKEEIGVINVLVAYAMIFAQVFSLGFMNTTTRMFPYFRDYKKNHHGFLFLGLMVSLAGALLALAAYFLLKPALLNSQVNDFPDFYRYIDLMIPIFISIVFFNFLDHYNKVLYNASRGILLKEIVLRLFTIVFAILMALDILSFFQFSVWYAMAYVFILLVLVLLLIKDGHFSLTPSLEKLDRKMVKEMAGVSFFGIISSATGLILVTIDRVMVKDFAGFAAAGVYTTCFYFGALVGMPTRAVLKIASTYIADAWKNNDLETLKTVYQKSSLNQFIVGALLFVGLIINLDNIDALLKFKFTEGLLVIPIIGLAYLTDMLAGTSASIINNSKYYRVNAFFMLGYVVLVIIGNFILIPLYGILGAAYASLGAKVLYNVVKYFFVWRWFKLQPFNTKFILILISAVVVLLFGTFLPALSNYILDIAVRSFVVAFIFIVMNYIFRTSDELNNLLRKNVPFLK